MASEEQPAPARSDADHAGHEDAPGARAAGAAARVPGPPVAELIARASAEVAARRPGAAHEETLRELAGGQMPPLAGTLARARAMATAHGGFAQLEALARAPGSDESLAADAALAGLRALSVPARADEPTPRAPARARDDARARIADTPAATSEAPAAAAKPAVVAEPAPAPVAEPAPAAKPAVAAEPAPAPAAKPAVAAEPAPAPAAKPAVAAEPAPAPAAKPAVVAEPAPAPAAKPAVAAEPAAEPTPAAKPAIVAEPAAEPTPAAKPAVATAPAPAPAPIAKPAVVAEPAAEPAPAAKPAAAAEPAPAAKPAVAAEPAPAPAPAPVQASEDMPEEVADAAIEGEEPASAPAARNAGRTSHIDIAGPAMLGTEIEIDIANVADDLLTGDASIDADLLSGDASIDADLFTGDAELDALLLDNGPADAGNQAELAAEVETLVRPGASTDEPAESAAGPTATPPPAQPADPLDDWLDGDLDDMDELAYSIEGSGRQAIEATTVGRADGGMFADEPTALQAEQSLAALPELRATADEPLPPLPIDGDAIPVMASDERASAMALPSPDFHLDGFDDEPDAAFELDAGTPPARAVLTRQQPGARSGDAFDAADMPTHVPPDPGSGASPLDEALDELEFDADLELDDIEIVEAETSDVAAAAPATPPSAPVSSPSERVAAGTPPYPPPAPPPGHAAQGYPTRPLTPVKPAPLPPSQNRPALPGLPPAPGEPAPNHAGQYPAMPSYPAPSTQPPPGHPPYPATPQAPYVPAPSSQPPSYPPAPSYPQSSYPQAPGHPPPNPGYPPPPNPGYPQTQPPNPGYPQAQPNPSYPVAPADQQRPGDDDDDKKRGFFGRIFKK